MLPQFHGLIHRIDSRGRWCRRQTVHRLYEPTQSLSILDVCTLLSDRPKSFAHAYPFQLTGSITSREYKKCPRPLYLLLTCIPLHSASEGAGFPDHPHRGQATVTYMIEGSFQHEDSAGHRGTIGPGDVQWMTAGRGIIHAEMPVHGPGIPNPIGLQLWVDLPKQHKMTAPSYQELSTKEIPSAFPEGEDGPVEVKIISGESHGISSPVRPLGGCWYMDIKLKKKGATVFQELPKGWTAFLYTLTGSLGVNHADSGKAHEPFHTLVLTSAANETGVHLTALEDNTRAVLISGEPLDQQVVQYGPFVMTTREEVQKTLLDCKFLSAHANNPHNSMLMNTISLRSNG
jgi:redox-sensitive bicupin YhaK (pirin superfamily)